MKIPIFFLHASARERAAPSTPSPSIPGVDTRCRAAGDVSPPPPCDFRMDNAFQRDAAKSLSSLPADAISRVGTREEKGRKTGSRRQRSGISLAPMDQQCAKGEEKKNCERAEKRVSITIDGPRCRFDHYRPSLRDRKVDLNAKSYLLASYLARARETPCLHTARRFECSFGFHGEVCPGKERIVPFSSEVRKRDLHGDSRRDSVFTQGSRLDS